MISHFHTSDILLQCTAVKGSKILRQNTISKRGTCQNYRTFLHFIYDRVAKFTTESGSLSFQFSLALNQIEFCTCHLHIWHLIGRLLVTKIVDLQIDSEYISTIYIVHNKHSLLIKEKVSRLLIERNRLVFQAGDQPQNSYVVFCLYF